MRKKWTLGLGAICIGLSSFCDWAPDQVRSVGEGVNVLFIAIDDLRPELGCYGSRLAITPNLDAFANKAHVFDRAVCAVPVCGASRASLMTGLRPHDDRFRTFASRADEDAPGVPIIAAWFKEHGYVTVSNGKILHKNKDSMGAWSEKAWRPERDFRDYQNPENLALVEGGGQGPAVEYGNPNAVYGDELTLEKSLADLERLSRGGQPFFLGVGFFKPHLPFCAPGQFWDLHNPDSIGLAENRYAPKNVPEAALHSYGELRKYKGIPDDVNVGVPDSTQRVLRHGYFACVSYVDHLLGRLLEKLEELGLEENTVVVIWGDHGWQLGEHNLWAKHCNFQTSLRVPLLLRLPGQTEGFRVSSMAELTDLYPTLCSIAGLEKPVHLEGTDLSAVLGLRGDSMRRSTFSKFHGGETVTTAMYSYTEFRSRKTGKAVGEMLFDLERDPNENNNVVSELEYRQVMLSLSSKLDSLRRLAKRP